MLPWSFKLQKCRFFLFLFFFFFKSHLHVLVLYHLIPRRNYRTFLQTGTQQIRNEQKQELPALLLKLLARLRRLSDISMLYPDREAKSISSPVLGQRLVN